MLYAAVFLVVGAALGAGAMKAVRRRQRSGKQRAIALDLPLPGMYLPKPPSPADYVPHDRLGSDDFDRDDDGGAE